MARKKTPNEREIERMLRSNGYAVWGHRGSHTKYKNANGDSIVIPASCNKMVVARLIKEHNLVTDW